MLFDKYEIFHVMWNSSLCVYRLCVLYFHEWDALNTEQGDYNKEHKTVYGKITLRQGKALQTFAH